MTFQWIIMSADIWKVCAALPHNTNISLTKTEAHINVHCDKDGRSAFAHPVQSGEQKILTWLVSIHVDSFSFYLELSEIHALNLIQWRVMGF